MAGGLCEKFLSHCPLARGTFYWAVLTSWPLSCPSNAGKNNTDPRSLRSTPTKKNAEIYFEVLEVCIDPGR